MKTIGNGSKIMAGAFIMLLGSTMASNPVSPVPHILWDAVAWGLHGFGAAPIIEVVCGKCHFKELDGSIEAKIADLRNELERIKGKTI